MNLNKMKWIKVKGAVSGTQGSKTVVLPETTIEKLAKTVTNIFDDKGGLIIIPKRK